MPATALPPLPSLAILAPPLLPPDLATPMVDASHPLALLPVRLETRFFAQPDGSQELRVRIFPDQIHVDSHEPALSPREVEWGQHFWRSRWAAGGDSVGRQAAWQQLADRFGAARAAWVAQALRPRNATPAQEPPTAAATPLFPSPPLRPDTDDNDWTRAPVARLLPQRWVAVARAGGALLAHGFSAPVQPDPALGPDPQAPAAPDGAPVPLAKDPQLGWLVDFARAEQQGMALRLRLPASVAQNGVDALLVFGVNAALTPEQGARQMAALLQAHHHTDGLAFVRPGTPTNNTAEEASGLDTDDPGHAASHSALFSDAQASLQDDTQAQQLRRALGLPTGTPPADNLALQTLGALADAGWREEAHARQMARALWGATWGYFLGNLVGGAGTPLTPASVDWARDWFQQHVRAMGPLPALRVGRQPYGLLPVTLLADWRPAPGQEAVNAPALKLRDLLLTLRDRVWRARVDDVPHLGRSTSPDNELNAALQTDGIAAGYELRSLLGPRYVQHLRTFLGSDPIPSGWAAARDALTHAVLQQLGLPWRPRLASASFVPGTQALRGPLVAGPQHSAASFIAPLLQALPVPVAAAPYADPPAVSLLHLLLRHSLQREALAAAAQLAAGAPGVPPPATLLRDLELVNFAATPATTWRMLLGQVVPRSGGQTLGAFLQSFYGAAVPPPEMAPLTTLRQALSHLQGLDAATLQRLMVGTLDTCSHRLDAWITSYATARLKEQRAQAATTDGLRVGAYGWVLNLRPLPAPPTLPTPAGETGPLQALRGGVGFLHAPSIMQAQTAALLRNGHLGKPNALAGGVFAVDLSSRRVRLAEQLLDGVRQDQPLGALLGYRFERGLHERRQDSYIQRCRLLAPLQPVNAVEAGAGSAARESVPANRVADGLRLHELWQQFKRGEAVPDGAAADSPFRVCSATFNELDDAVDALSDALVAESTYQAVRGNTVRTAATLAAVAHGEAPPPELEVARTPRSGTGVNHRVLLLLPAPVTTPASPGWPKVSATTTPRAAAEPRLNAWVATLLPPPALVRLAVERLDTTGQVLETLDMRLPDLGLCPLDLLAWAPSRPGAPTPELQAWALHLARAKKKTWPPDAPLRLRARRQGGWLPDEFSLREVLEVAGRARQLLASARAADARDLIAQRQNQPEGLLLSDITKRCTQAEAALAKAALALNTLLQAAEPNAAALRKALPALRCFGLPQAVPPGPAEPLPVLLAQARAALAETTQRQQQLAALPSPTDTRRSEAQRASAAVERLRVVFGADFLALPPFKAGNGAELAAALAQSTALQGGDPLAVHGWLQRLGRVRDGVGRLGAVLNAVQATQPAAEAPLSVLQLPLTAQDRWVGLPAAPGQPLPGGRLSLVVQHPAGLDPGVNLVAVWLDDWVEVVPNASETTAISFQFDAPEASAPQAVLLAVPPVMNQPWTAWNLHRLLLETLDLARLRAVDAQSFAMAASNPQPGAGGIGDLAHFLPATCFAMNVDGDAISPDFRPLT